MINKKNLRKDFIFLSAILLLSIVVFGIYFGFDRLFGEPLDFQVYTSYYVISPVFVLEILFFSLAFIAFLIRQLITRFKSGSGNIILISVAILLGVMIFSVYENYFKL